MVTQAITGFKLSATDYIQSSWIYQKAGLVGSSIQHGMTRVLDVVMPRNAVTQHREIRFLPTSVENLLGQTYYNDVCPQRKISSSSELTAKVSTVFKKLVNECVRKDELQFEVRVMEDDKTVNAFCLPGGKVVITTALLKKLQEDTPIKTTINGEEKLLEGLTFEDKLAAVLGHEISHACAGHGRRSIQLKLVSFLVIKATAITLECLVQSRETQAIQEEKQQRLSQGRPMSVQEERDLLRRAQAKSSLIRSFFENISSVIKFFAILSHGRHHELEADKYGIKLAAKAGYRPAGAIWLQHKFLEMKGEKEGVKQSLFMRIFSKSLDLFSTHPPSLERLQANRVTVHTILEKGPEAIYPSV
jgi:Zn-dependent protease with chaperone function